jgi:hypothetical protein
MFFETFLLAIANELATHHHIARTLHGLRITVASRGDGHASPGWAALTEALH